MLKYFIPLFLLSLPVQAKDVVVFWDLATERVDSTPLPMSEIAATRIEWGSCNAGILAVSAGVRDVAPPVLTTTLDLANGQHCLRAFTVDTDAQVSDPTATIVHIVKGRPKPPNVRSVK